MSFTAECPFCRIVLRGVPERGNGASIECPHCKNLFTLVAAIRPRQVQPTLATANRSSAGRNLAETPISTAGKLRWTAPLPAQEPYGAASTSEAPGINRLGVLSFFLGTMALLCASVPGLSFLVLPLAGVGLFLGSLGVLAPSYRKTGLTLPLAGLAVSIPVLAIAWLWPGVLGLPLRGSAETQAADSQTVYHYAKAGIRHVAPKDTEWADASQDAVQQAGVRVRVASVAIKAVEFKHTTGQRRVAGKCLVVKLRVSNAGADRLIEYKSWGEANEGGFVPILTDNTGKSLRMKSIEPGWSASGHVSHAWLPMAKWVDDVLMFEAPSTDIDYLHLELAGAALGIKNKFQLEIPRRMISFR